MAQDILVLHVIGVGLSQGRLLQFEDLEGSFSTHTDLFLILRVKAYLGLRKENTQYTLLKHRCETVTVSKATVSVHRNIHD